MPGMGGRMSTVIKAKISKMLDRAEDPAETLDYSYQQQLESLQNVKKGIADVVTAKKRLQMQSQKLEQSVVKLDTQARQALGQGNEELARVALERKNVAQTELQSPRPAGHRARGPAAEADRVRAAAAPEDRGLPDQEGGHQGAVLAPPRRRSGSPRPRPAWARRWPTSGWPCSAPPTRPSRCAPAPTRSSELEAAGTFEDLTALGSGQDDIDRQLHELSSQSQVDDELVADEGRARRRAPARGERRPAARPASEGKQA